MISKSDVQKLADLALLAIDESELEKIAGEMDSILDYVKEIDSFTAEGTEREEKPLLYNVFREDQVTHDGGEYTEQILSQAPTTLNGYIRVKKIL